MLTGKKFKFQRATLALDVIDGKRVAVTIPVGDIVQVVSGPRKGEVTIDILWSGRILVMFAVDAEGHGTEITERSAKYA